MKVRDVMTEKVRTCRPEENLAAIATFMFESDIGVLPVVDDAGRALGVITDRDIAIALGTRGRPAGEISVGEVVSGKVHACHSFDDIRTALKTMRHEKVHRLPVVNDAGVVEGILSVNDIILRAEEAAGRREPELSYEDAMSTLKAICEHRPLRASASA